MPLSDTARQRLEDVRELQPTTNGELQDRWGMDSGKDVARYLREKLGEHTYRDDESRIHAVDRERGAGGAEAGKSRQDDDSLSGDARLAEPGSTDTVEESGTGLNGPPASTEGAGGRAELGSTSSDEPQILELPSVDNSNREPAGEESSASDPACPECGSQKYNTVENEREKIRGRGYDPSAVPGDAWVCYDCWVDGEVVVYDPGDRGDVEGGEEMACPMCGSGKYDLVKGNREMIAAQGYDATEAPDDARVCVECWPDEVVVYREQSAGVIDTPG